MESHNPGPCDTCREPADHRTRVNGKDVCPDCAGVDFDKLHRLRLRSQAITEGMHPALVRSMA